MHPTPSILPRHKQSCLHEGPLVATCFFRGVLGDELMRELAALYSGAAPPAEVLAAAIYTLTAS